MIKIGAKINQMEMKKKFQRIKETKKLSFVNPSNKPLPRPTNRKQSLVLVKLQMKKAAIQKLETHYYIL